MVMYGILWAASKNGRRRLTERVYLPKYNNLGLCIDVLGELYYLKDLGE